VRAGEERWIAQALARLGVPILCSVHGTGVFEGADAAWINPQTALLATGLRTNEDGAAQVRAMLERQGVEVIQVGLPHGTMHLMGCVRLVDDDLALAWPGRLPFAAIEALEARDYQVRFLPDEEEAVKGHALNFVTLAPRKLLMAAGNPKTEAFYQSLGIDCQTARVEELLLAAGGIGCMTGVLWREPD
jgi:N-dimethylarginine dimethylaminohydrolase